MDELVALGETVRSYDPASGKVLWELALGDGRASATPVGDADLLYVGLGGRGRGHDGLAGGGPSRDQRAGKFDTSQHYRYRSESQSYAGRGLCKVAEARGDCASHFILVLGGRETRPWRGRAGIWKYVKDLAGK